MTQPTIQDERELMSVFDNGKDVVPIIRTRKKYAIGWMKGYTLERLSKLELKEGMKVEDEDSKQVIEHRSKFMSKAASLCILNGMGIWFFHWLYWRYLYYVKGYTFDQLEPIIGMAKKVPAASWYIASAWVNQMKITNMTMTAQEAERFQAALITESERP